MTKEQKEKYLEHKGLHCPYCESTELTTDGVVINGDGHALIDVTCDICEKYWQDEYTLTGIRDI